METTERTQQDGTANVTFAGFAARSATGKAYSLPTEALHQLNAALCAFTIIGPRWPAYETTIECQLCFRSPPMISMLSAGHFGRTALAQIKNSEGRNQMVSGLQLSGPGIDTSAKAVFRQCD